MEIDVAVISVATFKNQLLILMCLEIQVFVYLLYTLRKTFKESSFASTNFCMMIIWVAFILLPFYSNTIKYLYRIKSYKRFFALAD